MNFKIDAWSTHSGMSYAVVSAEWTTGWWWWKKRHFALWEYRGHRSHWRNTKTGNVAEGDVQELLESEWYLRNKRF